MLKIPPIKVESFASRVKANKINLSELRYCHQQKVIEPNLKSPKILKKSGFLSNIVYHIKKTIYKVLVPLMNKLNYKIYDKLYSIDKASFLKYFDIKNACGKNGRKMLGGIKIKNKKTGQMEDAFLTIRKIDKSKDYSKDKSYYKMDGIISDIINTRVKKTLKKPLTDDVRKNHAKISDNSYLLEVLDKDGIPVGTHFLDVRKNITEGKGLSSLAHGAYGGVGKILTEIKALTGAITGSKKVQTIGSWDSMPFHLKSGYKKIPNAERTTVGFQIYMPEENIDKIGQKYKDTEIGKNLAEVLG